MVSNIYDVYLAFYFRKKFGERKYARIAPLATAASKDFFKNCF